MISDYEVEYVLVGSSDSIKSHYYDCCLEFVIKEVRELVKENNNEVEYVNICVGFYDDEVEKLVCVLFY